MDALLQSEGEDFASFEAEEAQKEQDEAWLEHHRLVNIQEEIAPSEELREAVYYAYAKAISRRNREPLPEGRFNYHFFEGGNRGDSVAFGDEKRGYLLGVRDDELGIFTPTHFAPFSMRGGYDLLQELGESDSIPSILAITDDLERTLEKMPCWHSVDLPTEIVAGFHTGELLKKRLMYNEYFTTPEGQRLAMQAVAKHMGPRVYGDTSDLSEDSPGKADTRDQLEDARRSLMAA